MFGELVEWVGGRWDSWVNLITGVGTNHRKTAFEYEPDGRLTDRMLTDLVRGDAFAARIVYALPLEALRQGITVKCGDDPLITARVGERLKRLDVRGKLFRAWGWARQYGGAVIFVGADDGLAPDQPLNWSGIRSIRFLTVVDRRYVQPHTWDREGLSPRFGLPELYRFMRTSAGGGTYTGVVHHSRLIRFDGALVDDETRNANQGWGDSELQRVTDKLRQFNAAYGAAGTLMQDSSQGVMKLKNLWSLIASDKQGLLKKRLEIMELARSVGRTVLMDMEEEFDRVESGLLAGVPAVLDSFAVLLAGAVPMPVTVLMGRSPAGLNATGESDMRGWYDTVKAERTNTLAPRAETLVRMVLRAQDGPTGGQEPAQWSIDFPSLWQLSPGEEQEIRSKQAQTDSTYISAGVLTAEEVAANRFRSDGYSTETNIDLAVRRAAIEADNAGEGGTAPADGGASEGIMDVVERVGTRAIDRAAGIGLLTTQFGLTAEQAEAVMGETGRSHFTTPAPEHAAEMDALKAQHASAQASARGAKQMLARVLERNRKGELVLGNVIAAKPTETQPGDVLEEGDVVAVPTDAPEGGAT